MTPSHAFSIASFFRASHRRGVRRRRRIARPRPVHDPHRRDQQLQGAARVPRAVQEGHGPRGRRDQRGGRRRRPEDRADHARRQREPRRRGSRGRGADLARERRGARGRVPVEHRPRARRLREAEEVLLSRRRAADRQDHLGRRQQVHVPPASRHVHAGRDARARGRQAAQEALGARVSELRVRPVGDRRVQGAAEGRAARRRVRRRAGAAARQARRRQRRAGARRREARRDLQRAVRRRPRRSSSAKATRAACSRVARSSAC